MFIYTFLKLTFEGDTENPWGKYLSYTNFEKDGPYSYRAALIMTLFTDPECEKPCKQFELHLNPWEAWVPKALRLEF